MPGAGLGAEVEAFKAMKSVWSEHPQIKVLETKPGGYDQATAQRVSADILQANSGLDFFVSEGDQMSFGIAQSAERAGMSDKLKILGVGGSQRALDAIKAGKIWGTTLHNSLPVSQGRQIADVALKAARKEQIADTGIVPSYGDIPYVLTQDNQDEWADFKAEWRG
jgi:ribose transport system substrate-binding protein